MREGKQTIFANTAFNAYHSVQTPFWPWFRLQTCLLFVSICLDLQLEAVVCKIPRLYPVFRYIMTPNSCNSVILSS